ncbi:MAG: peptidylprolyl isomerase [Gemmatimonadales bacterium]|nr:peptidylprolyl isomerase [Gemmatimonadales bacterium]
MRRALLSCLVPLAIAVPLHAQALTAADTALVLRVLRAEDRRDAGDAALAAAAANADARLRALAARARARITDSTFARRDSLSPAAAPSVAWPEPDWRRRFRALVKESDCAALAGGLDDPSWPVRLRAAELVPPRCAGDRRIAEVLGAWLVARPDRVVPRRAGGVSWHAAAQAVVALARLDPARVRPVLPAFVTHAEPWLRVAAARAAATLADTATLVRLARDGDGNVQEAAVLALSRLAGHAMDSVYLPLLDAPAVQPVRAAALALKGSPRTDVAPRARAAFARWVARGNQSERDVRAALLEAAGGTAADDRPPPRVDEVPDEAAALALGREVRLRVSMDSASGGGRFTVRLRGDVAPVMAARILVLARRGYYDGLTWHRVEHDFVIQGGSPGANEYVGYPQFLRDELGTLAHPRGTVGMSTRGHDTGDMQWFVNLRDNARLRGAYTVWAEVVEGMDVVDGVMQGDRMVGVREVP